MMRFCGKMGSVVSGVDYQAGKRGIAPLVAAIIVSVGTCRI